MCIIGISTNCECGDTPEEALDNIKAAGFTRVMISEQAGDLERSLKHAQSLGLDVPFVHFAYACCNDLWIEGERNKAFVERIKKSIRTCGKYGVKTAVMHPTEGNENTRMLKKGSHGVDSMNEILSEAKTHGVRIAIENENLVCIEFLDYLFAHIDSPYLGFCYDSGHHMLYAPHRNFLKEYGHRCIAIHLHDIFEDAEYDDVTWIQDVHLLPFDGKINFEKIMENLAKTLYDGVIMLELHRILPPRRTRPILYAHMQPQEYLREAYKRGERLAKTFAKYKTNKSEKKTKLGA